MLLRYLRVGLTLLTSALRKTRSATSSGSFFQGEVISGAYRCNSLFFAELGGKDLRKTRE